MSRTVQAASLIRDQIDLYSSGATRATGVTVSDLALALFFNNAQVPWPLVAGSAVMDASISSGSVYFEEIQGSPGYYSVRFFPDRVGYWRLVLRHPVLNVEAVRDFDVAPSAAPAPSGLNASFSKP